MSLNDLTAQLDRMDRSEYEAAARAVVMRLTDAELLDHRIWASDDEPKRRAAVRAEAEGAAKAVRAMRASVPALAPQPAEIPEDSPFHSLAGVLAFDPAKPFVSGDLVWDGEAVWSVVSQAPTSEPPAEGALYTRVPAPAADLEAAPEVVSDAGEY